MATALNHHWCVCVGLHKGTLTVCTFCRCCGEVSFQKFACKCRVKSIMNANNRPGPARLESEGLIRYLKAQGK